MLRPLMLQLAGLSFVRRAQHFVANTKWQLRQAVVTAALAIVGGVAAMVAVGIGLVALYLWIEIREGQITALAVVGGGMAAVALILFAVAFLRNPAPPANPAVRPLQSATREVDAAVEDIGRQAAAIGERAINMARKS